MSCARRFAAGSFGPSSPSFSRKVPLLGDCGFGNEFGLRSGRELYASLPEVEAKSKMEALSTGASGADLASSSPMTGHITRIRFANAGFGPILWPSFK